MVARAPRKKMYRTMQGRTIDIEKLRAANESVQAVGNMKVNAKGDVLGPGGAIITPKETVIKKYYEKPKGMVSDTVTKGKPMLVPKETAKQTIKKMTPMSKTASKKTVTPQPKKVEVPQTPKTDSTSKKGIDAALDGLE